VDTGEDTMTGGRLKRVADYVKDEETFCLTYGDGVGDVNITELIAFHKAQNVKATLTATIPPGRFGALDLSGYKVKSFMEKPKGDGGMVNGGFFVLSPKVIDYIADDQTIWERRPKALAEWLSRVGLAGRYEVADFAAFNTLEHFDGILNFVGVGDPAKASLMGAEIFDVTLKYDDLALNYVRKHPECRYIFLSSGAAYGGSFDAPVDENTKAVIAINNLQPQDWYAVAKLHAECRHRALAHLPIVDIRVFNYFSHTQDMSARFLITDILRAIRDKAVLKTLADNMVRDFLHPSDFFRLVNAILISPAVNVVVDCYSKAPIDKTILLAALQAHFGLQYEFIKIAPGVNATGGKKNYYSLNKQAENFGYIPELNSLMGIEREIKNYYEGSLIREIKMGDDN